MDLSDSDMDTADNEMPLPTTADYSLPASAMTRTLAAFDTADSRDEELRAENVRLKDQVTALQRQLVRTITCQSSEHGVGGKRLRSCSAGDEEGASEGPMTALPGAEVESLKQALRGTQRSLLAMRKELEQERAQKKQLLIQVSSSSPQNKRADLAASEIRAIGLIASFLAVHPFGAELSAILAFLDGAKVMLSEGEVTALLCRATSLFRVIDSTVGSRWALLDCYKETDAPNTSLDVTNEVSVPETASSPGEKAITSEVSPMPIEQPVIETAVPAQEVGDYAAARTVQQQLSPSSAPEI